MSNTYYARRCKLVVLVLPRRLSRWGLDEVPCASCAERRPFPQCGHVATVGDGTRIPHDFDAADPSGWKYSADGIRTTTAVSRDPLALASAGQPTRHIARVSGMPSGLGQPSRREHQDLAASLKTRFIATSAEEHAGTPSRSPRQESGDSCRPTWAPACGADRDTDRARICRALMSLESGRWCIRTLSATRSPTTQRATLRHRLPTTARLRGRPESYGFDDPP